MIPFLKGDFEPSVTLTGRGIQIHGKICLGSFGFLIALFIFASSS